MAKPTGKLIRPTPESVGALPTGGTAVAATKLATARKINGVAFDGTGDINLSSANIGALTDAQAAQKYAMRSIKINGQPLSADVNLLAGDVNAWNKTEADGRYLLKAATAAAATKLATPRKINGVPFDGTADINLTPEQIGFLGISESGSGSGFYWRKYTDGRIELFGRFGLTIGALLDVVFPKVFTENPMIFIQENGNPEVNGWVMRVRSLSKTGFSVAWNQWSGSGAGTAIDVCYHAIGK
ncbi:hypothetical protein [Candidatus Symbiopectobacterium sp. NZEC151]|uniref:hypothetical protein n=2 Tax=unclassified Symbiopectobacterium TaxID=2794573 RepID=UPI0022275CD7|nr:hypothetical protein [Candidatus Symbiopectobacterium sp. NZEC151]MCW2474659.1 hypothetical protein [Candidatus Symbiopectobacterium sp. NZEC151]